MLRNGNNVALTSVLVSITIAYPEEVGEAMLPLLGVREFYSWDFRRATEEFSFLAQYDVRMPFAYEERLKSSELPHRRKYQQGLRDFIIDYQVNIRKLNPEIHNLFDKFRNQESDDNMIWKKKLNEIDIRSWELREYDEKWKDNLIGIESWELREYDEKLGTFFLQPKYDEKVIEIIDSDREIFEIGYNSMSYLNLIKKAYKQEEKIDYQVWQKIFIHYAKYNVSDIRFDDSTEIESLYLMFHRPVSLAILGLRDFSFSLNIDERRWCIETIFNATVTIVNVTNYDMRGLTENFIFIEIDVVLSSFHYLFTNVEDSEFKVKLIVLIIEMISGRFDRHYLKKILDYFQTVFFKYFPDEGKIIWVGLIKYAQFRNINHRIYCKRDLQNLKFIKEKEKQFFKDMTLSASIDIKFSEINFRHFETCTLTRLLQMTPYDSTDEDFADFIRYYIPFLLEMSQVEENHMYSENMIGAESYLAELLLKSNFKFSKDMLSIILTPVFSGNYFSRQGRGGIFDFTSIILKSVIVKLDDVIGNSADEELNTLLIENFWKLWENLFETIKNSGKDYFVWLLFLGIEWRKDISHWKALENRKNFYHKLVKESGKTATQTIVDVFSTIGEKTFLPDGISWLVEIYKDNVNTMVSLRSSSAERLIERLFNNHLPEIKNKKTLTDDFVWILDRMAEFGSSEAYLLREKFITYKQNQ